MNLATDDLSIKIILCLLILAIFPIYIIIKKNFLRKKLKIRAEKAARKIRERRRVMDYNRNSHHWENDH